MLKNSFIIMFTTLLSRILGLVRVTVTAYYFGSSALTDAYNSAFRLTNFFRQLLGEGALGSVFIPIYNEKEKQLGDSEAKKLIYSILNIITIFTMVVTILMIVFSGFIINIMVMGYSADTKALTITLFNIMAFYFVFIGLGSMLSAILNNFKNFFMPAFMSVMFNVATILTPMIFAKSMGIYSLAIGTLIGGFLEFAILLPSFFKIVKKYSLKIDWEDPYLKRIFIMLGPMMIGIMARQVSTVIDQMIASMLPNGTITALANATLIYNLPLGMFGVSVATAIFPTMSKAHENGNAESVKKQIEDGLKFLLFFMIPSIFVLTFFSKEVVTLLLKHGRFDDAAVKMTAETLSGYALGLYFYTGVYLMSRCFYIMKNTKDPVRFSILSIFINTVLALIFVWKFKHVGIAVSAAAAGMINFTLLFVVFNKKYIRLDIGALVKFAAIVAGGAGIALAAAMAVNGAVFRVALFTLVFVLVFLKPLLSNEKVKKILARKK